MNCAAAFRPSTVAFFTEGWCHLLAVEIHERTGWKLYELVEDDRPVHALVKLPDGRFMDIYGAQPLADLRRRWPCAYLRRVRSASYFAAWDPIDDWLGGDEKRKARRAADRLLGTGTR